MFNELAEIKSLLEKDPILLAIAKSKVDSLSAALKSCGKDEQCYVSRMKFTDAEIKTVGERLSESYKLGNVPC